jgi:hypothetical protein
VSEAAKGPTNPATESDTPSPFDPSVEEGWQALEVARAVIDEIALSSGLRLIERTAPTTLPEPKKAMSLTADGTEYLILKEDEVLELLS